MYRETRSQREFENFSLPFGGILNPDNRWVRLVGIIPWDCFERVYEQGFRRSGAHTGGVRGESVGEPGGRLRLC